MNYKIISILLCIVLLCGSFSACTIGNKSVETPMPTAEPTEAPTPEPTVDPAKVAHVILLLGQSNAVGATLYAPLQNQMKKDDYNLISNKGFDNIRMAYFAEAGCADGASGMYSTNINFNKHDKTVDQFFKKVKLGMSWTSSMFGPEVGMAMYLNETFPDQKFYIVKVAKGAVSINSSWVDGKYCWEKMKTVWDACLEAFANSDLVPQVDAICWMQGEDEGCEEKTALAYLEYQTDLVARLRSYFEPYANRKGIIFADAGISSYWKYYKEVNNCKRQFAELSPLNLYFDTMEAGYTYNKEPVGGVDYAHFDSKYVIKLGKKFAEMATTPISGGEAIYG